MDAPLIIGTPTACWWCNEAELSSALELKSAAKAHYLEHCCQQYGPAVSSHMAVPRTADVPLTVIVTHASRGIANAHQQVYREALELLRHP